jgi:hypothetical protein
MSDELALRCNPYIYAMDLLEKLSEHPLTCNYDMDNTGTTDILYMRLELINMQTNQRFYIGIGIEGYDGSALGEIDLFIDSCIHTELNNVEKIADQIVKKIN